MSKCKPKLSEMCQMFALCRGFRSVSAAKTIKVKPKHGAKLRINSESTKKIIIKMIFPLEKVS